MVKNYNFPVHASSKVLVLKQDCVTWISYSLGGKKTFPWTTTAPTNID